MFEIEIEETDVAILLALLAFGMRVYGITSQNSARIKAMREKIEEEAKRLNLPTEPVKTPGEGGKK